MKLPKWQLLGSLRENGDRRWPMTVSASSGVQASSSHSKERRLRPTELTAVFYKAGFRGSELEQIVAISLRESGGLPTAYNGNLNTGDHSYGLLQINTLGSCGPRTMAYLNKLGKHSFQALFDPLT